MGKNQAYKALQRAKMSSLTDGADELEHGMMDGSFHSPEWHAARLASLQTSHTITWEEYRRRLKEEAKRKGELEDSEARMMREYRAQLDAERASKLARGTNHGSKKSSLKKGKDKSKEKEKDKSNEKRHKKYEKKRHSRHETDSELDVTDNEEKSLSRKKRKIRKERNQRRQKRRESQTESSREGSSSANDGDSYGPLPLSSFFENGKG